jgi:hypothetical protein
VPVVLALAAGYTRYVVRPYAPPTLPCRPAAEACLMYPRPLPARATHLPVGTLQPIGPFLSSEKPWGDRHVRGRNRMNLFLDRRLVPRTAEFGTAPLMSIHLMMYIHACWSLIIHRWVCMYVVLKRPVLPRPGQGLSLTGRTARA